MADNHIPAEQTEATRETKKPRFNKNDKFDNKTIDHSKEPMSDSKRAILSTFTQYRDILDSHYDQRERIIKCSRDITALSKKMVFSLLRITQDSAENVFRDVEIKHSVVLDLFAKVAVDLQGSNALKYNRQATGGLQEYIEALGLWVFLRDNTLITKDQVEDMVRSKGTMVTVTDEDYVLGISDLPGEVNRYCINAIGKSDHEAVKRSLVFLRALKEGINLIMCSGKIRDLHKKLEVLDSSLEKTEKAYYSMSIRDTEMHRANIMDIDTSSGSVTAA
ncbi:hypothetical protein LPJ66_002430 [Kickxella alabastrina]|uniref:Uncharacterized protein n=1 Tax=Kickxella alabastrina TaxID=61397 RepID=A0ACC1IQF6_9FUNG|nr:hypothetical protein LPJ66_002430 [Kickxella alabastrina]